MTTPTKEKVCGRHVMAVTVGGPEPRSTQAFLGGYSRGSTRTQETTWSIIRLWGDPPWERESSTKGRQMLSHSWWVTVPSLMPTSASPPWVSPEGDIEIVGRTRFLHLQVPAHGGKDGTRLMAALFSPHWLPLDPRLTFDLRSSLGSAASGGEKDKSRR